VVAGPGQDHGLGRMGQGPQAVQQVQGRAAGQVRGQTHGLVIPGAQQVLGPGQVLGQIRLVSGLAAGRGQSVPLLVEPAGDENARHENPPGVLRILWQFFPRKDSKF